jgi:hypothetical protein
MVALFRKKNPEEQEKAQVFGRIAKLVPGVVRAGYRRKGVYEIIFAEDHDLIDPQTQALAALLANAWLIIWGTDTGRLDVGNISKPGYRIEMDSAAIFLAHRYQDHDEILGEILREVGVERDEEVVEATIPGPDGDVIKRKVSKRWFEEMLREGKIREVASEDVPDDFRHVFAQASGLKEAKQPTDEQLSGLEKQAELLVQVAAITATGLSTPSMSAIIERYPFLEEPIMQDVEAWDLLATAAGVCCGQFALAVWAGSGNLPKENLEHLVRVVQRVFDERFGDGTYAAVPDCSEFVKNSLAGTPLGQTDDDMSQTILLAAGIWVLWNLLGRQPSSEEDEAAGAIGYLLGAENMLMWDESQWPHLSYLSRKAVQRMEAESRADDEDALKP